MSKIQERGSRRYSESGLSRRDLLKLVVYGSAAFALNRFEQYKKLADGFVEYGDGPQFAEKNALVRFLRDEYGMELYNGLPVDHDLGLAGNAADDAQLLMGLQILKQEIIKYPRDYFLGKGYTNITFVTNLTYNGRIAYGDFGTLRNKVYIDLLAPADYIRASIHHEFYHRDDWGDRGYTDDDRAWIAFQMCTCTVYNKINTQTGRHVASDVPDWFMTPHGADGPQEDRASTAEVDMSASHHAFLLMLIQDLATIEPVRARVLREKMNRVMEDYSRWSDRKMDKKFWDDLMANRVDENYFASK